jgi:hypothetical protein
MTPYRQCVSKCGRCLTRIAPTRSMLLQSFSGTHHWMEYEVVKAIGLFGGCNRLKVVRSSDTPRLLVCEGHHNCVEGNFLWVSEKH